jgi:hypothetical protein
MQPDSVMPNPRRRAGTLRRQPSSLTLIVFLAVAHVI